MTGPRIGEEQALQWDDIDFFMKFWKLIRICIIKHLMNFI